MTELILKLFVKDRSNTGDPKVRMRYGIVSGLTGIAVNVILCLAKFFVGTLTNSIAITADAVNNLSDAGSSAVTVFGFKMSGRPADEDHPFGHGRIEYITAMIVSFIVLFMGFELGMQSVDKIRNPEDISFNLVGAIIIGVSILGKLWLALFNRKLGKEIDSPAMQAVVADSLSDIAATSVTLLALILSAFYPKLHIDGWLGIIVACFVLKAGFEIFKDTLGALIGEPPTKDTVDELKKIIMSYEHVAGTHDLILHNYGPGRFFGSVHVEMPCDIDPLISHDIIDNIEQDIHKKMGIQMTIHYDPIETDNALVTELRDYSIQIIKDIDESFMLHDFRIVDGPTHINVIFDLVVPHEYSKGNDEIIAEIANKLREKHDNCFAVIKVEHSFV